MSGTTTRRAVVAALSSALTVLEPAEMEFKAWIAAMRSGAYRHGFGLLRDGDDAYDPFGVLAAINAADFVWDGGQNAYTVGGTCDFLPTTMLLTWLRCATRGNLRTGTFVESFVSEVARLSDGAAGFDELCGPLTEAFEAARARRVKVRTAFEDASPRAIIGKFDPISGPFFDDRSILRGETDERRL